MDLRLLTLLETDLRLLTLPVSLFLLQSARPLQEELPSSPPLPFTLPLTVLPKVSEDQLLTLLPFLPTPFLPMLYQLLELLPAYLYPLAE